VTAGARLLDWRIIRRLYGYTRRYARLRNPLSAIVVLRAIQLPFITWAIARVLSGPVARRDAAGTLLGVAGFLAVVAFTEFCAVYRYRLALRLGEAVVHDLRDDVYAHLLRMPLSYFSRVPVGGLVARITSDIEVVRIGVQDVAFVSAVQTGSSLIAAGLMVYYDWRLFLVISVMGPGVWLLIRRLRGRLGQAHRDQQESFARVTATLAEDVAGIREIQSFAREQASAARFAGLIHDHARYNMSAARHGAIIQPALEWNGQLFLSLVLVIGGYQALVGGVPLAALIQFVFLSNGVFAAIPQLGNQYNQALAAMAGAERVFALLDTRPDWEDAPGAVAIGRIEGRVDLDGVGFAYLPGRPVLADVTLAVPAGRTVALVGATGSGKSTLASLVAKLYLPAAGRIAVDGRDLGGVTGPSLRRQIACVTQDNFLYSGTVAENIRVGRPDASDADIRAAARALDVEPLIEALPAGFATEVGEGGARLSLGQRQVVCFARAMLADPRILILDEATSSVDVLTETRMQAALARLRAGRTSFIIAHRLATVRHADEIVVLDHGRIVERGTHASLLAANGAYARTFRRAAGLAV
jgi:ATP-binding cassette subfamily B protein